MVSLGEDAVFCEGDEMAISFWMRILIVSLVNAFFFAHWLMCVRFCLAVFLLVQPSPQPMHLDSWVSCESGKWSGGSFVGGAAGRDGPGSGVREAEWVVSWAKRDSSSTACTRDETLGEGVLEMTHCRHRGLRVYVLAPAQSLRRRHA